MTKARPLHQEHPIQYPQGTPLLGEDQAQALGAHLDPGWQRSGTVGSAGSSPSATTSGMPSASPRGSRCSPNGSPIIPS
jgi:hypothetical protein